MKYFLTCVYCGKDIEVSKETYEDRVDLRIPDAFKFLTGGHTNCPVWYGDTEE